MVEARIAGRLAIGSDVNELAVFVSRVKTTVFSKSELSSILEWADNSSKNISLSSAADKDIGEHDGPYMRHMMGKQTWRLRRAIGNGLLSLSTLSTDKQRAFVRCALLASGQWALDCRRHLPSIGEFRYNLSNRIVDMASGAEEYARQVRAADRMTSSRRLHRSWCLNVSAAQLTTTKSVQRYPKPALILTSPPYPGVHVLYHRWQIRSRKETAVPYWIANCQDGTGSSYYTFGDRKQPGLDRYFSVAMESFSSIRTLCDKHTMVVQLVAFSDPSWQLPRYLEVMDEADFRLIAQPTAPDITAPLIRRIVPNRKWYAATKGNTPSSNEVLLVHQPK
jgi:hypothetical protein